MTPRERETELTAEVERELRALDEALAGLPVDPDLESVAEFARELRAERPEPDPEFTAALDTDAAAGFPGGGSRVGRAVRRLLRLDGRSDESPSPSRSLGGRFAWAGGLAAVLITAVVVFQSGSVFQSDGGSDDSSTAEFLDDSGTAELESGATPEAESSESAAEGGAQALRRQSDGDSSAAFDSGSADGAADRKVQRDAKLELSTGPNDVRRVADEAIEVIEDNRGIVFSSEIKERTDDTSVATLNVSVPTDRLQATMASLSDLAMVESRTDSSEDITGEFRSVRSFLHELQAQRESLLTRLANAATEQESESIRRRLRIVRGEIGFARAELQRVERRADRSAIDITVRGDGTTSAGSTIGGAADDAVDVLKFLAGVGIVAAAVIVPLGALLLIAWLIRRRVVHWQREQALDS